MNAKALMMALIVCLLGVSVIFVGVQKSGAIGVTIYIRADGSIDPPTAPIQRNGTLYTLTGNVTIDVDGIVIEKNNATLDGAGYTIQGTGVYYGSVGVNMSSIGSVIVKNMNIKGFYYGINLYSVTNCTITGNNITNNNQFGIKFRESSNCTVSNNKVMNDTYAGVWMFSSSSFTVSGNTIANHFWGVYLDLPGASSNILRQNNIMTNTYGIRFDNGAQNNVIWGNNITDNNRAISFGSSFYNTVYGNNIANNSYGVELMSSSNSTFHHNGFFNNTLQVYASNSANYWDQGYPLGGNYWSDYNGTDLKKGPYQNETGNDGIGDTPYTIDPNNVDYYPMIPEFASSTILLLLIISTLATVIAYKRKRSI
jgi:parallel beta-helix repeat protein